MTWNQIPYSIGVWQAMSEWLICATHLLLSRFACAERGREHAAAAASENDWVSEGTQCGSDVECPVH